MTPQNIGAYITAREALNAGAGTTPGTAVDGFIIDRFALGSRMDSCKIVIPYNYVKATGTTIALNAHLRDSPTSTGWTNFGSTVQTAGVGGVVGVTTAAVTSHGRFERNVDLTRARRYIRVRVTPLISVVSSINLLNYNGVLMLGGADVLPAS